MGTRSTIALEFADGTVGMVYCHWDGYLSHNGKILLDNYSDPFKLRELIDLGDISSLGPTIGVKHPFDKPNSYGDPDAYALYQAMYGDMTLFYGRDRGETDTQARYYVDFQDYKDNHQYEEYEYILRNVDGKATWFVSAYDGEYEPLTDAMREEISKEIGTADAVY
jgi:hypothetical protein